jgi:hypothetical protein
MKPARAKDDLSYDFVSRALAYEPKTGALAWRAGFVRTKAGGEAAGWVSALGYVQVKIGRRIYMAHRLAWLLQTGEWPAGCIDHINGVKTDNRLANLRDVSNSMNQQNRRKATRASRSGILGVARNETRKKWRAQIYIAGKQVFLGHFDSSDAASAAYLEAKRRLHAGCSL